MHVRHVLGTFLVILVRLERMDVDVRTVGEDMLDIRNEKVTDDDPKILGLDPRSFEMVLLKFFLELALVNCGLRILFLFGFDVFFRAFLRVLFVVDSSWPKCQCDVAQRRFKSSPFLSPSSSLASRTW